MTHLSVNINKIALIRNSRGSNVPDVLRVSLDCVRFGADGITLHPRPDERHARKSDVYALKEVLPVELNVEGFPSEDFLQMIEKAQPAQCTLVPDPPEALTSNAGWDTIRHQSQLKEIIERLKIAGVRSSIFIDPNVALIAAAKETGVDRIELYTEPYATAYKSGNPQAVTPYKEAAIYAHTLDLEVNAGHDLSLYNLTYFSQQVPHLAEVSIGHALVSDALYLGLAETIRRYQACLQKKINLPG